MLSDKQLRDEGLLSPHASPVCPRTELSMENGQQKTQNMKVDKGKIASALKMPEENIALKEEREQSAQQRPQNEMQIQINLERTNQEEQITIQNKTEQKLAAVAIEENRKSQSENYYALLIDEEELIRVKSEDANDDDTSEESNYE